MIDKRENCFELKHLIDKSIIMRNGRFIRPLYVDKEVAESLKSEMAKVNKNQIVLPPLVGAEGFQIDLSGIKDNVPHRERRYNLRKRK